MNRLAQAFACYVTDRSLHEALVVGWTRRFLGVNRCQPSRIVTVSIEGLHRFTNYWPCQIDTWSAHSAESTEERAFIQLRRYVSWITEWPKWTCYRYCSPHQTVQSLFTCMYIDITIYMYRLYSWTHRKRQGRLLSLDGSWRFSFYLVVFWLSAFLSTWEAIVSKHMHTRHYQCMLCAVIIVPAVLCYLQYLHAPTNFKHFDSRPPWSRILWIRSDVVMKGSNPEAIWWSMTIK